MLGTRESALVLLSLLMVPLLLVTTVCGSNKDQFSSSASEGSKRGVRRKAPAAFAFQSQVDSVSVASRKPYDEEEKKRDDPFSTALLVKRISGLPDSLQDDLLGDSRFAGEAIFKIEDAGDLKVIGAVLSRNGARRASRENTKR